MTSTNRYFKGIWIPKEIWLDENLTVMEKIFLVEIDSLDNKEGCWASNKYFADFFGITGSRASQIIGSLKKKKKVTIELIKKGKLVEKRIIRVLNKLSRGTKYSKGGYLENAQESNTKSSNTKSSNTKKFTPPTLEEVTTYCQQRKNNIDPQHFLDSNEAKGWVIGTTKTPMKDWQAVIRTWEKNNKSFDSDCGANNILDKAK